MRLLDSSKIIYYTSEGRFRTSDLNSVHLKSLHRKGNKPAFYWNGRVEYRVNGKFYRSDGPSLIDRGKYWYRGNYLHRTNGPAIDREDGLREWWQHGLRHREDGPAIEWKLSNELIEEYWLYNRVVTWEYFMNWCAMSEQEKLIWKMTNL